MEIEIGATTIRALRGDLTTLEVDAIVNAANPGLTHGGGVAAAIVRAGGTVVQHESDRWVAEHGPLLPGTAALTTAGAMPARCVVHVAGPVYRAGRDNQRLLRLAVAAALDAASAAGCRSVALPAISAGVFGYPLDEATAVIASEAAAWSSRHPDSLDAISLVGFDERVTEAFAAGIAALG